MNGLSLMAGELAVRLCQDFPPGFRPQAPASTRPSPGEDRSGAWNRPVRHVYFHV